MHRRTLLKLLAAAVVTRPMAAAKLRIRKLSASDEAFLDDFERRACLYFVEQASPNTGQVLDRARADNNTGELDHRHMASISATGFGLTALCIAARRGYRPRAQILEQVRRTLRYHADTLPNDHGFYSHFNDCETGKPARGSEISSIDSAIFFCGALTARAFFHNDPEIVRLATQIYNRVDFTWMLDGSDTFSMGLRYDKFLEARWNHYCELMMLPLLALGSPTHPVAPDIWSAFTRPKMTYAGFTYISDEDPLFVHQYSHAWFDFRGKHDKFANYFTNSVTATRAHQAFCMALEGSYNEDYWGISASDSAHGYTAWGGPPTHGGIDGSVVPCATAGSLPFLPGPCLRVLKSLVETYPKAWGRYGLCDAFNPHDKWYDHDVLGIDLGISVIMAENLRSGFVWSTFAHNPEVAVAFRRAGFTRG